jgi:signal transduction histidine kinase
MNDKNAQLSGLPFSSKELELRKRWLQIGKQDEDLLSELDQLVQADSSELIADMYKHFLSFEETRAFFPDQETLQRAQSAQIKYFQRLTKGNYDIDYVEERLKVGSTHHRIELDPKWYLGAYSHALGWFRSRLSKKLADQPQKAWQLMDALSKLIFFDMGLAIDAYFNAKEKAIRFHRDAIHELETERRVTKNILEGAPIGIISLDESYICRECNQEFLDILEKSNRSDVLGRPFFELCPGLDKQLFVDVFSSGQPKQVTGDLLFLKDSQTPGYWDWAAWPVRDEQTQTVSLVATFANTTDRVLLQQQREDFVATLTHDLKTPILAANRAIKLLLEGDFGAVSDSQSRILETIHQSNEAMYKLVQTLLDVYRYDSGAKQLAISLHNLPDTIESLVDEVMPLAKSKGITMTADLPQKLAPVECDAEEMRRVVQNFIDNALKFTPQGGSIKITVEQTNGQTKISVTDTGKGISEEDKPKLFQRFWQAASSGRYYASTGLGLYLCRKIVESHGGKIWCESTLGKGSTFSCTLISDGAK